MLDESGIYEITCKIVIKIYRSIVTIFKEHRALQNLKIKNSPTRFLLATITNLEHIKAVRNKKDLDAFGS